MKGRRAKRGGKNRQHNVSRALSLISRRGRPERRSGLRAFARSAPCEIKTQGGCAPRFALSARDADELPLHLPNSGTIFRTMEEGNKNRGPDREKLELAPSIRASDPRCAPRASHKSTRFKALGGSVRNGLRVFASRIERRPEREVGRRYGFRFRGSSEGM